MRLAPLFGLPYRILDIFRIFELALCHCRVEDDFSGSTNTPIGSNVRAVYALEHRLARPTGNHEPYSFEDKIVAHCELVRDRTKFP